MNNGLNQKEKNSGDFKVKGIPKELLFLPITKGLNNSIY
jgi:hypothetical protein